MLRNKDTNCISEIGKEITSSDTILERFLYWINFFDFKQVYRLLDKAKQKGYSASDLMKVLVMVPICRERQYPLVLGQRLWQSQCGVQRQLLSAEKKRRHKLGKLSHGLCEKVCKACGKKRNRENRW